MNNLAEEIGAAKAMPLLRLEPKEDVECREVSTRAPASTDFAGHLKTFALCFATPAPSPAAEVHPELAKFKTVDKGKGKDKGGDRQRQRRL